MAPALWMKKVKGISDIKEWYISTVARTDYVKAVFDVQCRIALENIERMWKKAKA
jgi:hypothetical protein